MLFSKPEQIMSIRVPTAAESEAIAAANAALAAAELPTYEQLVQLAIGAVGFVRTCQDLVPPTAFMGRLATEVLQKAGEIDDL